MLSGSPVLVAVVAVRAIPDVSAHALVLRVGLRLRMALGTEKYGIVGRVRVAVAAQLGGVVWNRKPRVIECRTRPRCGCVACLASRRKASGYVIGIRRPGVVGPVARVAISRNGGVVSTDVAIRASDRGVSAGQRECRFAVIESCWLPGGGVVTNLAGLRKAGLYVVRVCGSVEIFQVTGRARSTQSRKLTVNVATCALHSHVRSRQREGSLRMIEHCTRPRSGAVTDRTVGREASSFVIRIVRIVVIRHVTRGTSAAVQRVVSIHMALCAGDGGMRAG